MTVGTAGLQATLAAGKDGGGAGGSGSLSRSVEGSPSVRGWGRKCPALPFEAEK